MAVTSDIQWPLVVGAGLSLVFAAPAEGELGHGIPGRYSITDSRCSRATCERVRSTRNVAREFNAMSGRSCGARSGRPRGKGGRERKDYSIRLKPAITDKIAAHPANFTELLVILARERLELAIIKHIVSVVRA